MGCNCFEGKNNNFRNGNLKNNIIINRNLNKTKDEDKYTISSSFNQDQSINKSYINQKGKIEEKNINNMDSLDFSTKNNFPLTPHTFSDFKNQENKKENLILDKEYTCNISKINYNDKKENKQYKYKISQEYQIKKIIEQIKKESDYKDKNKNIFLFYKGNRIHNDDTVYDIINKNINNFDNIINNNAKNKKKESNEINFDMISFSMNIEDEENFNEDLIIKNEQNSFSSGEIDPEIMEKRKKEINKIKENYKEKDISKKILYKLSPYCQNHGQEQLIFICLTCYKSFCHLDIKEHKKDFKDHEIIPKIKLIELNNDIRRIQEIFIEKYKELTSEFCENNLDQKPERDRNKLNYISSNDLFSKLKISINDLNEEMENLIDSYRQSYNKLNSKFLSIYEEKMPIIIEYDEYIYKTITDFENINICSSENIFVDNYNNTINIKKTYNKYYQSLSSLKDTIIRYKEFLELFKGKGRELIDYIRKGIDNIMQFKKGQKIFNLNGAFLQINEKTEMLMVNNTTINNIKNNNSSNINNISITTNNNNQVINLKYLFSEKKKILPRKSSKKFLNGLTNISNGCSTNLKNKNFNFIKEDFKDSIANLNKEKFKNKIIDNKNEIQENFEKDIKSNEISLQNPSPGFSKEDYKDGIISPIKLSTSSRNNESDLIQKNIYSLLYGTKDIIQYNSETKKLSISSPDITDLKIKKFESYISHVNYKNKFYISGGYSTSKQFFEYDNITYKFIKLPEMLSNHYYHTMIGTENYIYSISGFKSKKIEKYNILEKTWTSMPDLSYERTYSNSLIFNNNIFVFGEINNYNNEKENIIEYLDISNQNYTDFKWNQIKLKITFPFNCGIIKLEQKRFLLVGGKIDLNEDYTDDCYYMNIKKSDDDKYEINIKLSDLKLEHPDEFNGNNFNYLDKSYLTYGLFSSINPYSFCLFNKFTNNFTIMKYENSD